MTIDTATMPNRVFPLAVQLRLQRAAQAPITKADPLARVRAIDQAIEWARQAYPEAFRWDD